VNQVTLPARPKKAARARLTLVIILGVSAIAGSLLLAAADAIRGTVTWAHHSPASAAPLFLTAAAIAAVSVGRPPGSGHGLPWLVAVLAFTAWGTGQVMPSPATAGAFNDAAILLFVIDGGYAVMGEARAILGQYRRTARPAPPQRGSAPSRSAAPLRDRMSPGQNRTAWSCCRTSRQRCTCAASSGQR
jgi:hypothetical protein